MWTLRESIPARFPSVTHTNGRRNGVFVCFSTDLLPGAGDADAVLDGDLGRRVSTRSGVLSKAQVIIGAQVNHILQHPACVSGREREDRTEETVSGRKQV